MAKNIMIQGTMSNAGKSLLCAGLCRIFKQDGYRVAPFKSQNMALNSFITADGGEMGRAQVVQAEAAGIAPDVRMNPILLKPTTDVGSQVIVNGQVQGNMKAMEYYQRKREFLPAVLEAYKALDEAYDIVVIEGAGSPAEINLKQEDIVNMGLAKLVDAPVLLVGDIDRGGVFAQLYGTVALLEPEERARVRAPLSTSSGETRPFWSRGSRPWRSCAAARWRGWCPTSPWTLTTKTACPSGSTGLRAGSSSTLRWCGCPGFPTLRTLPPLSATTACRCATSSLPRNWRERI